MEATHVLCSLGDLHSHGARCSVCTCAPPTSNPISWSRIGMFKSTCSPKRRCGPSYDCALAFFYNIAAGQSLLSSRNDCTRPRRVLQLCSPAALNCPLQCHAGASA
eukprot:scaffold117026_cov33-Tisochrysis_lutea.AAC.5